MQSNYKILTSYWFIIILATLLFNDLLFKGLYGNWLTGKISDFAGLFIFPLFWTTLFPRHKTKIFWLIGFLFIFWKSQFSQSLIDLWNSTKLLNIYRTVDYSDLFALTVLPISYIFESKKDKVKTLKLNPILILLISAFSFIATSYRTDVNINKTYNFDFPKDTLVSRLNKIENLNSGFGLTFTKNNPDTVEFSLPSTFCFNAFKVKISVAEVGNNKTNMTLISAIHSCPEDEKDIVKLTKEFEKIIIEKIMNGL